MKKLTAFLFMVTMVLAFTVTAHAAGKQLVTTGDVNLRKGPGLKYAVTTSVKKGTALNYAGSTKKDNRGVNWYKVSYKNKGVWVSSRYAKFSKTKTVRACSDVNLRKGPGLKYAVATSVKKGTNLNYAGTSKRDNRGVNWFKVNYKGKGLWISSRFAQFN